MAEFLRCGTAVRTPQVKNLSRCFLAREDVDATLGNIFEPIMRNLSRREIYSKKGCLDAFFGCREE
jgi:hypothetical protein